MDRASSRCVVGIDVGGKSSRVGVVNQDGHISGRASIRTDEFGENAVAYVEALAGAVRLALQECGYPVVEGVGIGVPNGNYFTGEVAYAPNLSWASAKVVPLAAMMSNALGGVKVKLTNDANAAACGEMKYGAAVGMTDFIEITMGTGLGSGIVCGGNLVYGHDGLAGELGHVCVDRDGRLCGCGGRGCLETYVSATGLVRTVKERLEAGEESSLSALERISAKDVYDAALAGDRMAKEAFDYTGTILGRALADFVAFSSPEAIILFGGLAQSGELIRRPAVEAMEQNLLPVWKGKIKVLFSSLDEDEAAILGASALGWE